MSRHSSARAGKLDNRGAVLVASLALAFLMAAMTTVVLMRSASLLGQASLRHKQASALFLAEAGVQKAAAEVLVDPKYSGERGTRLETGSFDVSVTREGRGFVITSTGFADSPFRRKPRQSVRAVVLPSGGGRFRIADWRENP